MKKLIFICKKSIFVCKKVFSFVKKLFQAYPEYISYIICIIFNGYHKMKWIGLTIVMWQNRASTPSTTKNIILKGL